MNYPEIAKIDVGRHIEKKNGLSYLSWAWAVDQLLRIDNAATWEYREPVKYGDTVMVFCSVTCNGITRTAQLPVMDHRNKAIANPDAFAVNTAMQRCLAKGIALHGLGLYIYAGEDIPAEAPAAPQEAISEVQAANIFGLAQEVGADLKKFCTFFRIARLEELPASRYAEAITALEKKRTA